MLISAPMPNTRSAAKRVRSDAQRHQRNLKAQSELKTLTKKFLQAVQTGNASQARTAYQALAKRLDQAAGKNILHRKTASRKKSRLGRRLARIAAPAAA